jgi:hypothetical protein
VLLCGCLFNGGEGREEVVRHRPSLSLCSGYPQRSLTLFRHGLFTGRNILMEAPPNAQVLPVTRIEAAGVQSLLGWRGILLPEQFFTGSRRVVFQPEQRLMLAVLRDAVQVFQLHAGSAGNRHRRLFREADAWFAAADRSDLFGFGAICDALGLDATYLYAGLRRSLPTAR